MNVRRLWWFAALLLSFAAAWGLAELMAVGWAFLIVAVIWGVAGGLLFLRARERFRQVDLKPAQTIDTLKEDLQWAKNQKP